MKTERPLPSWAYDALRDPAAMEARAFSGRYGTNWMPGVAAGLALAYRNAGLSFGDFATAMTDPRNAGGAWLMAKGKRSGSAAVRWLRDRWDHAERAPAVELRGFAHARLREAFLDEAFAVAGELHPNSRASYVAVVTAVGDIIGTAGRVFHVSCRSLAEAAHVKRHTACAALDHLYVTADVLRDGAAPDPDAERNVDPAKRGRWFRYPTPLDGSLSGTPQRVGSDGTVSQGVQQRPTPSGDALQGRGGPKLHSLIHDPSVSDRGVACCGTKPKISTPNTHLALSQDGAGTRAGQLYALLDPVEPLTARTAAHVLGVHRDTARRYLRALKQRGLAYPSADGWRATEKSLDSVLDRATEERAALRRVRHQLDRIAWDDHVQRRRDEERVARKRAFDPATGEILEGGRR